MNQIYFTIHQNSMQCNLLELMAVLDRLDCAWNIALACWLCLNFQGLAQNSRALSLRCHNKLRETHKNKRSPLGFMLPFGG